MRCSKPKFKDDYVLLEKTTIIKTIRSLGLPSIYEHQNESQ